MNEIIKSNQREPSPLIPTDYLESTDSQEVPGKVFVKDDIEQYNKNRNE